ncbi:MAG: hypothetical protein K0M69_08550 [Youngiibacter sp.]|nr:hypothetical protein [Youngiibacter sp.]
MTIIKCTSCGEQIQTDNYRIVKEKDLLKREYRAVCYCGELVIDRVFFEEDMEVVGWKC